MITGLSTVTVLVRDQEEAYQFFTQKLGFKKKTEMQMEGKRWLTVIPETGNGPEFLLFDPRTWMPPEPAEEMLQLIGKIPGNVLATNDCRGTIAEMESKGVTILRQPEEYPYGIEAVFADPFGNSYVLVQLSQQ